MSKIDWSKALPGFDFHLQPKRKGDIGGFYKIGKTRDRFESVSGGYILFSDMTELSDLFVINSKPAIQEWTGEGLPPVGTVCELRAHKLTDWSMAKIEFAYRNVIVWDWIGEPSMNGLCTAYAHNVEMRPIRTPEQIAADLREKAAEELYLAINWNDTPSTWANLSQSRRADYFKAIDAGWNKFEIIDEPKS